MLGGLDLKRFDYILVRAEGGPEQKNIGAQPPSVKNHLHLFSQKGLFFTFCAQLHPLPNCMRVVLHFAHPKRNDPVC